MILDEGRDEVVALVIARRHAQRQREPNLFCHHIQPLRLQLIRQELIAVALIENAPALRASARSCRIRTRLRDPRPDRRYAFCP